MFTGFGFQLGQRILLPGTYNPNLLNNITNMINMRMYACYFSSLFKQKLLLNEVLLN